MLHSPGLERPMPYAQSRIERGWECVRANRLCGRLCGPYVLASECLGVAPGSAFGDMCRESIRSPDWDVPPKFRLTCPCRCRRRWGAHGRADGRPRRRARADCENKGMGTLEQELQEIHDAGIGV